MRTASGAPVADRGQTRGRRRHRIEQVHAGRVRTPTDGRGTRARPVVRHAAITCDDGQRVRPSRSHRRPPPTPHRRRVAGARRARLRLRRRRRARREPVRPAHHRRARGARARRARRAARSSTGPTRAAPSLTLALQGIDPTDADVATAMEPVRTDLAAIDGVASVIDPLALPGGATNPAAAPLVANDGDGFLVVVELDPGADRRRAGRRGDRGAGPPRRRCPRTCRTAAPGVTGIVGGTALIVDAITDAGGDRPAHGRGDRAADRADHHGVRLRWLPGRVDADGRRHRVDRRRPRGASRLLLLDRPRLVRRQHRDRARARPVDRLRPAHGVPVPRGAAPARRRGRRSRQPAATRRRARCSPRSSARWRRRGAR